MLDTTIDDSLVQCGKCGIDINLKQCKESGNIFLYLSLRRQLQGLCELEHHHISYAIARKKDCAHAIEDIFNGKMYKTQIPEAVDRHMLSVNFSVNGTP